MGTKPQPTADVAVLETPAAAPTRETIYTLDTRSPYALGESSKMSNGWTNPTGTNGDWAVTLYGSDAKVVAAAIGGRQVVLPDGGIRFLADTLAQHQAINALISNTRARKDVRVTDSICVESTVCRVDDAVRGPEGSAAVAAVPNRNFPLLALRVSKPTPVILETSPDGKRRLIIEID
jgi:hypothetical protein